MQLCYWHMTANMVLMGFNSYLAIVIAVWLYLAIVIVVGCLARSRY